MFHAGQSELEEPEAAETVSLEQLHKKFVFLGKSLLTSFFFQERDKKS